MDIDQIALSNLDISYSEVVEDDDALYAKFIICDFLPNKNGVMLNRETIEQWMQSLVTQPVVGKLGVNDNGNCDFEGHNMRIVHRVDERGKTYETIKFDTDAFGVFTDVAIEKIRGKEFIVATAKIWKRFTEFCAVIKRRLAEGRLFTSWEIKSKETHNQIIRGKKIKVIDDGKFIGHALLNEKFDPAYSDSQMLEVASKNDNQDLIEAISKDLANIKLEEDKTLTNKVKDEQGAENVVLDTETSTETPENEAAKAESSENESSETEVTEVETTESTEVSALTESDLRKAIRQAIAEKLDKDKWEFHTVFHFPADGVIWIQLWDAESELDIIKFTYTVENDAVTIGEPKEDKLAVSVAQINGKVEEMGKSIDDLNGSLVKASTTINDLKGQITELTPYKEKFEKAEQEKVEAELAEKRENLKAYAISSGYIEAEEIETSEEIKAMIEQVDESKIKALIAERFVAKLDEAETPEANTVETSEAPKANIDNDDDEQPDYRGVMNDFLHRK